MIVEFSMPLILQTPTGHIHAGKLSFLCRGLAFRGQGHYLSPGNLIKCSIVVLPLEPVLLLNLLGLNLFLSHRIMVTGTIKIDDVIGILEDRLRGSQSVFTNALELSVAITTFG